MTRFDMTYARKGPRGFDKFVLFYNLIKSVSMPADTSRLPQ